MIWSRETGLVVPPRLSPFILRTFFPLSKTVSIRPVKRHRVNPEFIKSRNDAPMAFTAESPPAQGQQSSR